MSGDVKDVQPGHVIVPDISIDVDPVLSNGKVLKYIADQIQRGIVGNRLSIELLTLVCLQRSLINGHGIYVQATGKSSEGKSYLIRMVLEYMPPEYVKDSNLTTQAIYYNNDGTGPKIYYIDDFNSLNEDLKSVFKNVLTNFRKDTKRIVTNTKTMMTDEKTVPARTVVLFSGVDNINDRQMMNRLIPLPVENDTIKKDIHDFTNKIACGDLPDLESIEDHQVLVCREIIRRLTKKQFYVDIPFSKEIEWPEIEMDDNRKYNVFLDLIRLCAIMEQNQRDINNKGELVATYEDFYNAARIYMPRRINQRNKLAPGPQKLLNFLMDHREQAYRQRELAEKLGVTQQNISNWCKILLEMSPGVIEDEDVIEKSVRVKDGMGRDEEIIKPIHVKTYQYVGEGIISTVFDTPLQLSENERSKPEYKAFLEKLL